MSLLRMINIFLKEQLRAPFSVLWTIASPVVLFFFLHFDDIDKYRGNTEWLRQQVAWFVGYISLSVILFSYCLYLNGRRESGFVATFVHDVYSKCIFIIAQLVASLIMSTIYVLFFLLIIYAGFRVNPDYILLTLTVKSLITSVILMLSFTWLASLPLTFQTANVVFSVIIMACMVLGIISFRLNEGFMYYVNTINPILIYSRILNEQPTTGMMAYLFYALMLVISLVTLSRFRTEPVWSSQ